jgi:hypothetical protein
MVYPSTPLPIDHFQGLGRIVGDSSETLVALLNTVGASMRRFETTQDVTLYIDPVNGSDSNDGLSASRPIRTCAFLRTLIPYRVKHNITVNFAAGDLDPLTLMGMLIDPVYRGGSSRVSFLGTTGLKTLTTGANTGNPSVALQDYIEKPVGAADWTVNEMVGELLFVVAGPGIGKKFLIRSNTGTRMYLAKITSSPLNVLDTFEVRERKTKINCSTYGAFGFGGLELLGINGNDGGVNAACFQISDFDFYNPGYFYGIFMGASSGHLQLRRCRSRAGAGLGVMKCSYVDLNETAFVEPDGSSVQLGASDSASVGFALCVLKGGLHLGFADCLESVILRSWVDIRRALTFTRCYGQVFQNDFNNTEFAVQNCQAFDTLMNSIHNAPGEGLKVTDTALLYMWMDNFSSNTKNGIRAVRSKIFADSLLGSLNGQHGIQLENGSFLEDAGSNVLTGALGDLKPGALAAQAWAAGPTTDPTQLVRIHT